MRMSAESHTQTAAVFLSYASQDAEAAKRICEALRGAGIEVWFDQSELRGGDAWDQSIRRQIKNCALFLPVISRTTHDRREGYFRLEWKLAIDRNHLMDANMAFLLPVAIDDTRDNDERVPERFREVQWTRLPAGEAPLAFVERVQRLLAGETLITDRAHTPAAGAAAHGTWAAASKSRRMLPIASAFLVSLGAIGYLAFERPWIAKSAAFAPPPHSVAVLPFVNMSGDKEQEYFSDGLTEELLNSLAGINELQVAGRTSAFSFKGKDTDLGTIARKLNVGAILEGSVRRSGNTIRISTELINAVTGFQLWSKSYDRDLGDVLKLQTEIATAVAGALKVALLGDIAQKIELGGTRNPVAFDAYLRASKASRAYDRAADLQVAIADYSKAIRMDPGYALAFADRSVAFAAYARNYAVGTAIHENYAKAQADANQAIALAPELAEAHLSLATVLRDSLEFTRASEEYQRAVALGPGSARVLGEYGEFAAEVGHTEAGLAAVRHALVLDPLSSQAHNALGYVLVGTGRYPEAIKALTEAKGLAQNSGFVNAWLGYAYYGAGDLENARLACEAGDDSNKAICLALVYEKLGRHVDAKQMLSQVRAKHADDSAVFYAMIYAQWGDNSQALQWLEVAMRNRDPYLIKVKMNGYFDPLRQQPRFQAVMKELKFPD
jgi:TolB-like protein